MASPWADYLTVLDSQEQDIIELLSEEFEDDARSYDMKNPVATTWLISFPQIQQHDLLAADYISFMACIDHKDIPQLLLPPSVVEKEGGGCDRHAECLLVCGQTLRSLVERPASACASHNP